MIVIKIIKSENGQNIVIVLREDKKDFRLDCHFSGSKILKKHIQTENSNILFKNLCLSSEIVYEKIHA